MAHLACRCGYSMWNGQVPNTITFTVFSDARSLELAENPPNLFSNPDEFVLDLMICWPWGITKCGDAQSAGDFMSSIIRMIPIKPNMSINWKRTDLSREARYTHMLEMIQGCKVPDANALIEQYQLQDQVFTANVNAEKIKEVMRHFINIQKELLFFVLELPANEKDEIRLRQDDTSPLHKDIYYMDALTREEALALLSRYGERLVHDGLSHFGFGVQDNSAEIISRKYNIITLWTNQPEKYDGFFEAHDIPRVDRCLTAWDTFTPENPGESTLVEVDGKTVFDLPGEMKDWGLYFAEQREC